MSDYPYRYYTEGGSHKPAGLDIETFHANLDKLKGQTMTPPDMTLRDYFAGLAMTRILKAKYITDPEYFNLCYGLAEQSYTMADAMMEARKHDP